jgi:hypothetical protein
MSYYAIGRNGQVVRVSHRYTQFNGETITETPVATLHLRCGSCGWETKAIKSVQSVPTCICGGLLQTINVIE